MKKTLLVALTVIGASLATAQADVAFSISFGSRYHYTPRPCYTPPPVAYCPPPQPVYYSQPVYTEPVYTAPVYSAPVYAPVAPVVVAAPCPPPVIHHRPVVVHPRTSFHVGFDSPKYGHGGHHGGHHGSHGGYGYKR